MRMGEARREFELKIELTAEQWRRLLANPSLKKLSDGPARSREIVSVYFDTAAHVLHANGLSLRLRRSAGGARQTVKAETGVRGGISNPLEAEVDLTADVPDLSAVDGALGERLRDLVGEEPLAPVFETAVLRITRPLSPDKDQVVELALDEGHIRAGNISMELREAEFELMEGDADTLLSVAEMLLDGTVFAFGAESKAERGYRLLRGESAPTVLPEKSVADPMAEEDSCAAAFAAVCRSASRQVLVNWQAVIDSADPEGPHQLRIGLRRLRTALRMFRRAIDSEALRRLAQEARLLSRRAGQVRDLDVIVHEIVGPLVLRNPDMDGLRTLQKLLRKQASRQRVRLQRELAEARWAGLRLRISLLPHGAGWKDGDGSGGESAAHPAAPQAQAALSKTWKKVRRQARQLDTLPTPERHELRKRLKAMRYASEFFAPLFPEAESDRFAKRLRRLLDTFGYLNDIAMAEKLTELCRAEPSPDAERDAAAGYVLGWHSARAEQAWESVPARWRQLKRSGRFWD